MGLRILHSADWHMDSPFAGFTPEQRRFLKAEQQKVPVKIAELCIRENCDLMVLSGDIFDGPYSRETVAIVRSALERCGVPVLIAPGNHDPLGSGSVWQAEPWPENVHIFRETLQAVTLPELDCRVYGAGYRSMDCPALLQDFRAAGRERYQLAVLHGDPMALNSPYCPVTAAQVRDSGLDYLALGHIHKAGSFRARHSLCGWPGCPMGRGYDETREKGVYIVDIGEETQLRFVALDTPRFFEIEVDMDRLGPEQILPAAGSEDFFRMILTGSHGRSVEEILRAMPGFPNLEFIDRRQRYCDPWEKLDEDSLEGTYLRLLREKLWTADPETEELVRLAAEISTKILAGREVIL